MSADPTGLDKLHDILVPAPAPWWPLAPGWYWVLGLAAVIGAVLLWRVLAQWQRNRYRREALAHLAQIEARIEMLVEARTIPGDAQARTEPPGGLSPDAALAAMAVLLKRTALTAYSREQVAGLSGSAWFAFLDRTGGTRFSDGLGAALARANYLADGTAGGRTADVASEIRRWIRQHGKGEYTGSAPEPANTPLRHSTDNQPSEAA